MTITSADPVTAVLRCRYRLATGCTAGFASRQAQGAHEKSAHAACRVELRVCPECPKDCGNELKRATHLSAEHGIRAGSERRQELDARQVRELLGARLPDRPAPPEPPAEPAAPEAEAATPETEAEPAAPEAETEAAAVPPPDVNPAAPPDPLAAARDAAAVLAAAQDALAGEVEALRAENAALGAKLAELKADQAVFATVRALLCQHGQDGGPGSPGCPGAGGAGELRAGGG